MKAHYLTRVTSAMVVTLSLLVPVGPVAAQREGGNRTKVQQQGPKKGAQQRQAQPKQPKQQVQQRQAQPKQQSPAQPRRRDLRLPQDQQRQRVEVERQRVTRYRAHLDQHRGTAQNRYNTLMRDGRRSHYAYQRRYDNHMQRQWQRIHNMGAYNYYGDPYVYAAPVYRYNVGGTYYPINWYGANLLRQAANYGYAEGFRAGEADRHDRWRYGFEESYAYLDANYGYPGFYVDQSVYNYYFREGFRRGYEDGYYNRYHYGHRVGTSLAILGSVLAAIVVLEALDD